MMGEGRGVDGNKTGLIKLLTTIGIASDRNSAQKREGKR
jgi:hypothetical protein